MVDFFDQPKDPSMAGQLDARKSKHATARPDGNRAERRAWKRRNPTKAQAPEIRSAHMWREPDGWCVLHEAYDRPPGWQPAPG